jgi:hypothetical protein
MNRLLMALVCAVTTTTSASASDNFFARRHISRQHLATAYAIAEMEISGQSFCGASYLEIDRIKDRIRRKANKLGYSMTDIRAKAKTMLITGLPAAEIPPTCALVWGLVEDSR